MAAPDKQTADSAGAAAQEPTPAPLMGRDNLAATRSRVTRCAQRVETWIPDVQNIGLKYRDSTS